MAFITQQLVANGVSALGRVVYTKAVLDIITNSAVVGMVVNVGGAGYVVGENFDIVGGTPIGTIVARGIVTSESGGVVTGIKYISSGAYSALPGVTGAATTNASASGNNALTVDLTTDTAKWTLDRSTYIDDLTDFEWLCTSVKASNPPTIGMTCSQSGGNEAAQLLVSSGFNNGFTFAGQPDASPIAQMWLNIVANDPQLYLSTTERRVNVVCRDGGFVQYGVMGLFIPFTNVEANYPFAGMVAAQTQAIRAFTDTYNQGGLGTNNAGICNPGTYTTVFPAARYRDNLSTVWKTISVTNSAAVDACMWPHLQSSGNYNFTHAPQVSAKNTNPFSSPSIDESGCFKDDGDGWFEAPLGSVALGVPGVAPFGTGQRSAFVVPSHIIQNGAGDTQIIGVLDGLANVHGVGLTGFDEISSYLDAVRYIVWPDTGGADTGQWVAMEII